MSNQGLFGGGQNNNNQAQPGNLFGNQNQQQPGGLFGANTQNQTAAPTGGLFAGQPTGNQQQGGLFGQNAQQGGNQGGLFNNAGQQQQSGQQQNLFGQPQNVQTQNQQTQNKSGLFGGNQPQQNAPTGGLFNNQNQTPNPTGQTQQNLFANVSNQQVQQNAPSQQNTQGSGPQINLFGNNQQQQAQQTQQKQTQPQVQQQQAQGQAQPQGQQTNLFGGNQANTQAQQQNAPTGISMFGNQQNQPAANTTQPAGGLFGQPGAAKTETQSNTQPGGGLFGQKTQVQPQADSNAPTANQQPKQGGLFGNNTSNQPATTAPTGGLFGNNQAQTQPQPQAQQPQAQQPQAQQPQAQQPQTGLFGNKTTTAPQPAQNVQKTGDQPQANANLNLFNSSVIDPKPKAPAAGEGLFAKQPTTAAPTININNENKQNPATQQQTQQPTQQPATSTGLLGPKSPNPTPQGGAANLPTLNIGGGDKPAATATETSKGGLFDNPNTTAGQGIQLGAQKPVGTAQPTTTGGLLSGAPPTGVTTAAQPSRPVDLNQLPAARKTHQLASQATGIDERLEMDIQSAISLNGSLLIFCQNIHKYKPDHVKKFFQNAEIQKKLQQGLLMYKTEQISDQWEIIKKETKEGKSPLKFWTERLSKYKYQYLIVMIIEELADYLQIKPMDCYQFFNIFLTNESRFVDFFFDPSSNEPCIEFFYEQQALSCEGNNVGIRKDSPFIVNLKTSFMKDVYFHERKCILDSLRLLLLTHEVVKGVMDTLFKGENNLEKSLWEQYTKPQINPQLSAEDNELFQLQQQFENDQIIKLLFIISNKGYSKVSVVSYLDLFVKQSFMGNWEHLQPQNENSFESKNKINELSTVIGDSCLMLILSKQREILQIKEDPKLMNEKDKIETYLKSSKNNSQQIQVLSLFYVTLQREFKISQPNQIEYLYKLISRVLNYKNLGVLKADWQKIFFEMLFKIISGVYDSGLQDTDENQENIISECLSRALSKSIYKNSDLINLFWEKIEQKQLREHFLSCFKSPLSLYKIMKSVMGMKGDPKAGHVIAFLTTIEHFNWYGFHLIVDQQNLDDNHLLKLRLMYKLIIVDPKCIDLLQLVFKHPSLNQNILDEHYKDCQGNEVIKFVIRVFPMYNDFRVQSYQNFYFGLKALNVLINNHQYLTQDVLQYEEFQELFSKEYIRLASQNDISAIEYRMKCKREILNILYTILKDFEEPLLAFSPKKSMERNTEYDSPLLLHLFIFFGNFIEDWEQNQGVIYLKHKWKIGNY